MNYVILNERDKFENQIHIHGLKEVDVNGSERVDVVFANITREILEQFDADGGGGDTVLPEQWLLSDGGVSFILCPISRDILYNENTELIEKMFRLFNKESFYIELRGYNRAQSYNQIEQYIFCYNKCFEYHRNAILPDVITKEEQENNTIFEILLDCIKKEIL